MDKNEIRAIMKKRRRDTPPDVLLKLSARICTRLIETSLFKEAGSIWCYVPLPGEVDTTALFRAAWAGNKTAAAPKVTPDGLRFHVIRSFSDLTEGHFHVREPEGGEIAEDDSALIILPGLSFDKKGNRIGYGKGYYDRFLSSHPGLRTAGAAFDFSVMDDLPHKESDVRADIVVTESRIYTRS